MSLMLPFVTTMALRSYTSTCQFAKMFNEQKKYSAEKMHFVGYWNWLLTTYLIDVLRWTKKWIPYRDLLMSNIFSEAPILLQFIGSNSIFCRYFSKWVGNQFMRVTIPRSNFCKSWELEKFAFSHFVFQVCRPDSRMQAMLRWGFEEVCVVRVYLPPKYFRIVVEKAKNRTNTPIVPPKVCQ